MSLHSSHKFSLPQAPCNEFIVFFRKSTNVHVHFDQSLDEVQRTIVLMRPQIVNLLALFRYQLFQVDPIRWTALRDVKRKLHKVYLIELMWNARVLRGIKLEGLFLRHVVEVEHKWVHNRQALLLDDLQNSWQMTLANRRNIEALAPVQQVQDALKLLIAFVERVHEQAVAILWDKGNQSKLEKFLLEESFPCLLTIITNVPSFRHSPFKL